MAKKNVRKPKPDKPVKPVDGGEVSDKDIKKGVRAARRAGKRSFGKNKPGVRAVSGKKNLSLSEEQRLQRAIQKELEADRTVIRGRVYEYGKPEMDSAKLSKLNDGSGGAQDLIKQIKKTDPVLAAEYQAREETRKLGLKGAERDAYVKKVVAEEKARQKAKSKGQVVKEESAKPAKKTAKKAVKKAVKKPLVKDKPVKETKAETKPKAKGKVSPKLPPKDVSKALAGIDYEDKIKGIEKQMSENAKAVRAGTMTEAEKKTRNASLAKQKNALQAEAKRVGAKVNNPANRPARTPKADKPKVEKPKVEKPKVEKKAKPAVKKSTKPVEGKGKTTAKPSGKAVTKTDIIKEAETKTGLKGESAVKAAGKKGLLRGLLRKSMAVATLMWAEELIAQALPGKPIKGGTQRAVKEMVKIGQSKVKGVKPVTGTAQLKSSSAKASSKASVKKGKELAGQRYQAQADALRGKKAEQARWDAKGKAYGAISNKPSTGKSGGSTLPNVNKSGQTVVTIKRGDTLWDIAQKNKTTVDAIYKANPFLMERKKAGKTQIFSGTTIRLPKK